MATYVYTLSHLGSKTEIAKLENGRIYDQRYTFTKDYIADAIGNNVHEKTVYGHDTSFITAKDNISYYQYSTFNKSPLYIAIKGYIYSYSNYSRGDMLAEYTGDPTEAVLCYTALVYFGTYKKEETMKKHDSITKTSSGNNKQTSTSQSSGGGGWLGTFIGLFLISLFFTFCKQHPNYLTAIFYLGIPGIILLILFIVKLFTGNLRFSIGRSISGFLGGLPIAFIYVLIINAFIHKYCDIQVVNEDMGIICAFVLFGLIISVACNSKSN